MPETVENRLVPAWKRLLAQFWAWREFGIFLLAPFALLPQILLYDHDPVLGPQMRCAYVMELMIIYWVTECIPIAITSLVPMVAFPLLRLERSTNLAPMYLDETNMAIIASILVVEAFEEAELHRRFAFAVIRVIGVEPKWLLLGLMTVSWFLSMLLSNAMAATLIVPVVIEVVAELREAIRSNTAKAMEKFQNDSPAALDPGTSNFSVVAHGMSRKKAKKMIRRYENMLVLAVAYSCSIGGTATLLGQAENLIIRDEITEQYEERGCVDYDPVNFASWLIWGMPGAILFLPLAWLWVQVYYLGPRYAVGLKSNAPSYIHDHKNALYEIIRKMHDELKPMSSRQWIVLVHIFAMVLLFFTRLMHTNPLIGWEIIAPDYVRESTVACFIAILLFAFPVSLPKTKQGKVRLKRPKNAIHWSEEDGGRAFNIVLLIGGGLAASNVAISSGLAQTLSDLIYDAVHELPETVTVVCLVIFSVFLTELVSNAASVHFMLPILADLAHKQHVSPLLYMMPTALTASFAFMFPVATPPNAVAFSLTKGLRVVDMLGVGFVMNIIGIGIVLLATNTWGNAYFELYLNPFTERPYPHNGTYLCHSIWDHIDHVGHTDGSH